MSDFRTTKPIDEREVQQVLDRLQAYTEDATFVAASGALDKNDWRAVAYREDVNKLIIITASNPKLVPNIHKKVQLLAATIDPELITPADINEIDGLHGIQLLNLAEAGDETAKMALIDTVQIQAAHNPNYAKGLILVIANSDSPIKNAILTELQKSNLPPDVKQTLDAVSNPAITKSDEKEIKKNKSATGETAQLIVADNGTAKANSSAKTNEVIDQEKITTSPTPSAGVVYAQAKPLPKEDKIALKKELAQRFESFLRNPLGVAFAGVNPEILANRIVEFVQSGVTASDNIAQEVKSVVLAAAYADLTGSNFGGTLLAAKTFTQQILNTISEALPATLTMVAPSLATVASFTNDHTGNNSIHSDVNTTTDTTSTNAASQAGYATNIAENLTEVVVNGAGHYVRNILNDAVNPILVSVAALQAAGLQGLRASSSINGYGNYAKAGVRPSTVVAAAFSQGHHNSDQGDGRQEHRDQEEPFIVLGREEVERKANHRTTVIR